MSQFILPSQYSEHCSISWWSWSNAAHTLFPHIFSHMKSFYHTTQFHKCFATIFVTFFTYLKFNLCCNFLSKNPLLYKVKPFQILSSLNHFLRNFFTMKMPSSSPLLPYPHLNQASSILSFHLQSSLSIVHQKPASTCQSLHEQWPRVRGQS